MWQSIQPRLHPLMLNFGKFCNVWEITLILNRHTMYLSFCIVALWFSKKINITPFRTSPHMHFSYNFRQKWCIDSGACICFQWIVAYVWCVPCVPCEAKDVFWFILMGRCNSQKYTYPRNYTPSIFLHMKISQKHTGGMFSRQSICNR